MAKPVVWLLEGADQVTGETLLIDSGAHLIAFTPGSSRP